MTEVSKGDERDRGTPDVTIHDPDDVIGGVAGGGGGGERATGTPNTIYDLSSVLFHALEGGASYDTYVEDAEQEGDEELAEFFRRVREEDRDRAAEARLLLAERALTAGGTADTARGLGASEGSESDLPPRTEPMAEGAPSGDPRREHVVAEMPDEDLTPPEEAVPPDAPGSPEAASRAEAAQPPRTEPIAAQLGPGDVPSARTEEVPPARVEDVPVAEDVPSGTPPQAPPGDVQGPKDRGEEGEGLIDKVRDALLGEEQRGREGTGREDRR